MEHLQRGTGEHLEVMNMFTLYCGDDFMGIYTDQYWSNYEIHTALYCMAIITQ